MSLLLLDNEYFSMIHFVHITVFLRRSKLVCCFHAEFFIFIIKQTNREDSTAALLWRHHDMMACITGGCNSSVRTIIVLLFITAFTAAMETSRYCHVPYREGNALLLIQFRILVVFSFLKEEEKKKRRVLLFFFWTHFGLICFCGHSGTCFCSLIRDCRSS